MRIGENIYKLRVEHRLSQEALAQALDVSRQSVSKWENDSAVPELEKLAKMADLFQVTLDELVYGPRKVPEGKARPQTRVLVGSVLVIFGMVFFLLSIFWGDRLYFGEAFGELMSVSIVLLSMSLLASYNFSVLSFCGIIYLLYSFVCFGVLHVNTVTNYVFVFVSGLVLLVWFITWGLHENRFGGFRGKPFDPI